MRNPLYLAIVLAVTGQALLFSHPMLLAYAAVLLAAFVAFVHWYEEPTLARRFGGQYEAYANRCPVGGRARQPNAVTLRHTGKGAPPASANCAHALIAGTVTGCRGQPARATEFRLGRPCTRGTGPVTFRRAQTSQKGRHHR